MRRRDHGLALEDGSTASLVYEDWNNNSGQRKRIHNLLAIFEVFNQPSEIKFLNWRCTEIATNFRRVLGTPLRGGFGVAELSETQIHSSDAGLRRSALWEKY